eukprot:396835-Rhodomonas_salina.1
MSGTELVHRVQDIVSFCATDQDDRHQVSPYAMSGTELAYAALRCPVLASQCRIRRRDVRY